MAILQEPFNAGELLLSGIDEGQCQRRERNYDISAGAADRVQREVQHLPSKIAEGDETHIGPQAIW